MGAWIEILHLLDEAFLHSVAPLVGAWIEIAIIDGLGGILKSLPLWERGLKYFWLRIFQILFVAPLVGAWIEIFTSCWTRICWSVAPLVGAWIEILTF